MLMVNGQKPQKMEAACICGNKAKHQIGTVQMANQLGMSEVNWEDKDQYI